MIATLVVTHGSLADALVEATRNIVGTFDNVETVSFGWKEDPDALRERFERACERLDTDRGLLILTDMFGGTPTNLALTRLETNHVEIVTGVNLPMLLKLSSTGPSETLLDVARSVCEQGRSSMRVSERDARKKQGLTGPNMLKRDILIQNRLGLHARAAAKLVHLANSFTAEVRLKDHQEVNAKSILGILILAAGKGTSLTLTCEGPDEAAAIDAIAKLFADRFHEDGPAEAQSSAADESGGSTTPGDRSSDEG